MLCIVRNTLKFELLSGIHPVGCFMNRSYRDSCELACASAESVLLISRQVAQYVSSICSVGSM